MSLFDAIGDKLVTLNKEAQKPKLSDIEKTILKFCVKARTSSEVVALFPARGYNPLATLEKLAKQGLIELGANKYVTSLKGREFEPVMVMTAKKGDTGEALHDELEEDYSPQEKFRIAKEYLEDIGQDYNEASLDGFFFDEENIATGATLRAFANAYGIEYPDMIEKFGRTAEEELSLEDKIKQGTEELFHDNVYKVWKITTPEALYSATKDIHNWDTHDIKLNAEILAPSPFYGIYANDKLIYGMRPSSDPVTKEAIPGNDFIISAKTNDNVELEEYLSIKPVLDKVGLKLYAMEDIVKAIKTCVTRGIKGYNYELENYPHRKEYNYDALWNIIANTLAEADILIGEQLAPKTLDKLIREGLIEEEQVKYNSKVKKKQAEEKSDEKIISTREDYIIEKIKEVNRELKEQDVDLDTEDLLDTIIQAIERDMERGLDDEEKELIKDILVSGDKYKPKQADTEKETSEKSEMQQIVDLYNISKKRELTVEEKKRADELLYWAEKELGIKASVEKEAYSKKEAQFFTDLNEDAQERIRQNVKQYLKEHGEVSDDASVDDFINQYADSESISFMLHNTVDKAIELYAQKKEAYSKKDYIQFANIIKDFGDTVPKEELIDKLIEIFKRDNSSFDEDRFREYLVSEKRYKERGAETLDDKNKHYTEWWKNLNLVERGEILDKLGITDENELEEYIHLDLMDYEENMQKAIIKELDRKLPKDSKKCKEDSMPKDTKEAFKEESKQGKKIKAEEPEEEFETDEEESIEEPAEAEEDAIRIAEDYFKTWADKEITLKDIHKDLHKEYKGKVVEEVLDALLEMIDSYISELEPKQ